MSKITHHWRAYIGDAAQLAWTQDNGLQLLFTLKDRLGSATTLVNQDGQLISRRCFDPFGKSASELPSTLDTVSFGMTLSEFRFTDLTETNRYRRGFTGHEHLNEQQLIHMNGRIYDYNLGRFMSVDPVIQSPANTQSVNPYSYIMNNPLAGTDPPKGSSTGVDTRPAIRRMLKSHDKAVIMRSGHTHWDSNQRFSGHDARYVMSMTKFLKNKKFKVSVSTSNGSYRELNYKQAKSGVNTAQPEGRLIRGVTIGG